MKKVWFLMFILFSSSSSVTFGQEGDFWGIASHVYYDRYYDRTFDLNFMANGVRALGTGNASIAIADDPTALSINPAGITQLKNFYVSAGGRFDIDSREYQEPKNVGMKILADVTPIFSFNSFSVVLPVTLGKRQLVAGLAYNSIDPRKKTIDDTHYYYGGGRVSEIKDIKGSRNIIAPGIAVEIIPDYAIGATYHFLFGESNYNLRIQSPYADKTLYFGFDDKEKYSGSYLDVGLFAAPFRWLSIGLIFTPSWKYTVEEKSESFTYSNYSSETGWTFETIPTSEDSLDKFEIDIPQSFGLGIALKPISSITVAFDYRVSRWTESKINNISMKDQFGDASSYHFGMEYRVNFGAWQVPLRLGYCINHLPNKDCWFDDNYEGNQLEYEAVTLGWGFYKGAVEVDFAYENGSTKQSWWRNIGDYFNDRHFITTDRKNQVIFSLSYKFDFRK